MKWKSSGPRSRCIVPRCLTSDSGYLLFEALLSVVVLSIGLVAVIRLVQNSTSMVHLRSHYLLPAQEVAESVLAEIETGAVPKYWMDGQTLYRSNVEFRVQVASSEWPLSTSLAKVEVVVRWIDRGKPGSLTLTTLVPVEHSSGSRLP